MKDYFHVHDDNDLSTGAAQWEISYTYALSKRTLAYYPSLATLAGCAVFSYADFNAGTTVYTFNNMFVSDPMSNLLKLFTYLAIGITLVVSLLLVIGTLVTEAGGGIDLLDHPARSGQALEFRLHALTVFRQLVDDLDESLFDDPTEPAHEAESDKHHQRGQQPEK